MKWYLLRNSERKPNRLWSRNPGTVEEYYAVSGVPRPYNDDDVPKSMGEPVEIPEDLAVHLNRLISYRGLADEIAEEVVNRLKAERLEATCA